MAHDTEGIATPVGFPERAGGRADAAGGRAADGVPDAAVTPALTPASYAAIALVSATILLLEIAFTRILSVVVWYHFAFLSISLAMLGLGAPGVWFTLRPAHRSALPAALLASGVAAPASVIVIFKLGHPLQQAGRSFTGLDALMEGGIVLLVVSILVPMLCLGTAVCLLLLRARGRQIGGLYAMDLLGAAAGAAAIVPLMHAVPTPLIVAGTGLLPLAAAAVLARRARPIAIGLAGLLLAAMVLREPFRLRYTKEYAETNDILFEKWTPTGRITVHSKLFFLSHPEQAFLWGTGRGYRPEPVDQLWIEQDGSAGTPITRLLPTSTLAHLFFDVTSVGLQLQAPRRVCVIGAGGGRDILSAVKAGATDIDAVELNPVIVQAVSGPFGDFSGHVYGLPGVKAVASEGRSFLTRSPGNYDLLQISLIDSWAATAAGAFALSENYLYTVEAFQLYWRRLSENGLLSVSRYWGGDRLFELARLVLLARRALERDGVPQPAEHLAIVRGKAVGSVIVSRRPFTPEAIRRLDELCTRRGFDRIWPLFAEERANSAVARFLETGADPGILPGLDLRPPTDDWPFFFQSVSIFGSIDDAQVARLSASENSVLLLRGLLVLVTVLAVALFFSPFLFAGRRGDGGGGTGFWRGNAYFVAIGLAFFLVEGPWIQRFILYLGHPSYATTVVLSTLLLGAGLGSLASSRLPLERAQAWFPAIPVAVALSNLLLPALFAATLGWSFPWRAAASIVFIAPIGFLMGFPFPCGMVRFGDANKAWFWAMNGVASVLASVFTLALSMSIGLSRTTLCGAVAYVAACLLLGFRLRGREAAGRA